MMKKIIFIFGLSYLLQAEHRQWLLGTEISFGRYNQKSISISSGICGGYEFYIYNQLSIRSLIAIGDGSPILTPSLETLLFWTRGSVEIIWDIFEPDGIELNAGMGYDFDILHSRTSKDHEGNISLLPQEYQGKLQTILGIYYKHEGHGIGLVYRLAPNLQEGYGGLSYIHHF